MEEYSCVLYTVYQMRGQPLNLRMTVWINYEKGRRYGKIGRASCRERVSC